MIELPTLCTFAWDDAWWITSFALVESVKHLCIRHLWIHSAKYQNRSDNCATLANPKTVATRPNLWRFLMLFFYLKFHCNPMVVPRNPWVQVLCPGLMAQVATMIPWWRNSTSWPHTCGMRVARTGGWWLAMECWSELEWWADGTPCFYMLLWREFMLFFKQNL